MALGNSNTTAQARGKNRAVKVQRRKEVVTAKGYTSFSSCTVQSNGSNACAATMDQTYYHDGSGSTPTTGDKVYARARANDRYFLEDGNYKMDGGGGRFKNIQVASGIVVGRVKDCR